MRKLGHCASASGGIEDQAISLREIEGASQYGDRSHPGMSMAGLQTLNGLKTQAPVGACRQQRSRRHDAAPFSGWRMIDSLHMRCDRRSLGEFQLGPPSAETMLTQQLPKGFDRCALCS